MLGESAKLRTGAKNVLGSFGYSRLVYPRTFYTDLNSLWLLAEWH
jgi:hypothetical protein